MLTITIVILFAKAREEIVKTQIEARGIHNPLVLKALRTVPRHLFVPPHLRDEAYQDSPPSHWQ